MPKVSVIIPVYNVEPYLRRCIDSVINQTLRDIEIILVDDGSTDGSGKICDDYAVLDSRVHVIHKPNEGLSCARNDGIDASTAPYLMFVDSDDWVSADFCAIPFNTAVSKNADIVVFQLYHVKEGKIRVINKNTPTGIVDALTALEYGGCAAWNKLYDRKLFSRIRYPEGKYYEDIAITHRIFFLAKRIVLRSDILYYYFIRKGSITHRCSADAEIDAMSFSIQRWSDLRAHGYVTGRYERALKTRAITYLIKTVPNDDEVFHKAEEIANSIIGIPSYLNWKIRIMLLVWKIDKRLFHIICKVFGKKIVI